MKLMFHATVTDVREKSFTVGGKKDADGKAELFVESAGWWITISNHMSLFVGHQEPTYKKGDRIRLVIEPIQENSSDASEKTKSEL
jgi:hypothetical protein